MNGSYGKWKYTGRGVPHGSVLGPLLFDIFSNDLLMFVPDIDICNYADDTTLHVSGTGTIHILKKLESSISTVAGWLTGTA